MQVKSIAECSKGSILQYFGPSFSYQLSLRSLFCLFLSGRFTQVLLYAISTKISVAGLYYNCISILTSLLIVDISNGSAHISPEFCISLAVLIFLAGPLSMIIYEAFENNHVMSEVVCKIVNIFLSIGLNICFGCSKEPSHRDGSFEYSQHILGLINWKFNFKLCTVI